MSTFAIERSATGRIAARGDLDFATAADALKRGLNLMHSERDVDLDLTQVTSGDSAGLAVLIEWLADARARGVKLHYVGVPAQILAVARISDIDHLLSA